MGFFLPARRRVGLGRRRPITTIREFGRLRRRRRGAGLRRVATVRRRRRTVVLVEFFLRLRLVAIVPFLCGLMRPSVTRCAGLRRTVRLIRFFAVPERDVLRLRLRAARCRDDPKNLTCLGVNRRFLLFADGLLRFLRCGFASLRTFVTCNFLLLLSFDL